MRSISAVATQSTAHAIHSCRDASVAAAQTATAFASERRTIFVANPTGPENAAIARDGSDHAAVDAAVSREGAGLGATVVLTKLLSAQGAWAPGEPSAHVRDN